MATSRNALKFDKALQVVRRDENGRDQLLEDNLKTILLNSDITGHEVVVLSIAGAFRTGKSFLLCLIHLYLRHLVSGDEVGVWLEDPDTLVDGFHWIGGEGGDTTGIWMLKKPFLIKRDGQDPIAVILMDTQGGFDGAVTTGQFAKIFAVSALISSIQIYNITANLQEDHLQNLKMFTKMAKVMPHDSEDSRPLHRLLFLIRDYKLGEHGLVVGNELLRQRLQVQVSEQTRKLGEELKNSYESLECFTMPDPGAKICKKTTSGTLSELSDEFREMLPELMAHLFSPSQLKGKMVADMKLTSERLFEYFQLYWNAETIVEPGGLWDLAIDKYCRDTLDQAVDHFKAFINPRTEDEELANQTIQEFDSICESVVQETLQDCDLKLMKNAGESLREMYLPILKDRLRDIKKTKLQQLHRVHDKVAEGLHQTCEYYKQKLLADLTKLTNVEVLTLTEEGLQEINERHMLIAADTITAIDGLTDRTKHRLQEKAKTVMNRSWEIYKANMLEKKRAVIDHFTQKALEEPIAHYEKEMSKSYDELREQLLESGKWLISQSEILEKDARTTFRQNTTDIPTEFRNDLLDRLTSNLDRIKKRHLAKRKTMVRDATAAAEEAMQWCGTMVDPQLRRFTHPPGDALITETNENTESELKLIRGSAMQAFKYSTGFGEGRFRDQYRRKLEGVLDEKFSDAANLRMKLKNETEHTLLMLKEQYRDLMKRSADQDRPTALLGLVKAPLSAEALANHHQKHLAEVTQKLPELDLEYYREVLDKRTTDFYQGTILVDNSKTEEIYKFCRNIALAAGLAVTGAFAYANPPAIQAAVIAAVKLRYPGGI